MHLLQSGVPFNVTALWLGHESTNTTHRYVEADLAMKQKALARLEAPDTKLRRSAHRTSPDSLMRFLQTLADLIAQAKAQRGRISYPCASSSIPDDRHARAKFMHLHRHAVRQQTLSATTMELDQMRQLKLPDGTLIPVLGLGTWRMGEAQATRDAEVASVRSAIELGYRLIDTAEMYGEGGAETVVGRALAEAIRSGSVRREDMCLVSKVYPHNASRLGTSAACDRSRQRLGVDRIDLYLLHWRGSHPLAETVEALQALVDAGKVRHWGVSNLDVDEMRTLDPMPSDGGVGNSRCATNQVYYSLTERGPEFSLLPWMRERSMPLMAYSPIDQGSLAGDSTLAAIGEARGLTAAQVALAWIVSRPGVIGIPKALSTRHLQENIAAEGVNLSEPELRRIESRFPAPGKKAPLAML